MLLPVLRPNSVSSCISHVARTCGEPTENGRKLGQTARVRRKAAIRVQSHSRLFRNGSKLRISWWWRGLDSNQRTLARADLQSAAFNHSATSPRGQAGAPCGGTPLMCQRAPSARVSVGLACPLRFGAGEGNRTLVVSLEGFCSTIELHPLADRPMPSRPSARQPISPLTATKPLPYDAIRMTNLVAIAASSIAHRWWWRDAYLAARWRD